MSNFKTIRFLTEEKEEVTITVEWVVLHFDPGCYGGPPEYCYPAELEIDILKSWTEPDGKDYTLSDKFYDEIMSKLIEEFNPSDYYLEEGH